MPGLPMRRATSSSSSSVSRPLATNGLAPARVSVVTHGDPVAATPEVLRLDLSVNPGTFEFHFDGLTSTLVDVLSQDLLADLQTRARIERKPLDDDTAE